jgi:CCR4-NOT transcription complex subunit 3
MERFKAMERELKTKAYSQAGLMSGLNIFNLANKVDPEEAEKEELREWINELENKLTGQIDKFEAGNYFKNFTLLIL